MDIVVVGGGIIGTMHAWIGLRRGHRVVHLEREDDARGASVRSLGLIWISGRAPGPELDLALRARELWTDVGAATPGLGFRAAGSLTVARSDAEASVLAEAVDQADAKERGLTLLDQSAAKAVNPGLGGVFTAALHCEHDAIVEPRVTTRALRAMMSTEDGYTWLPGREVVAVGEHRVVDDRGHTHQGDLVVLATGASLRGIVAEHVRQTGRLRRRRMQVMQTHPWDRRLTTATADGDALRYYPAFAGPAVDRLPRQAEVASLYGTHLLMVQRRDGSLTIGASHAYAEPFDIDLEQEAYDHLTHIAEALLGSRMPSVRRRWSGVDTELRPDIVEPLRPDPGDIYHRGEVAPGVVLVTGAGSRGFTLAPAIAEQTLY